MGVIKLSFDYGGELRDRLAQIAPDTHRSIHVYSKSIHDYFIFQQNKEVNQALLSIFEVPNISDSELTTYEDIIDHLVEPLRGKLGWREECIERTLESHFRKSKGVPATELHRKFTIALARCINPFILESYSTYPAIGLFDIKSEKVHHYLPLPRKNDYPKLFS